MTVMTETRRQIVCDGCHESPFDPSEGTAAELRRAVRAEGWVHRAKSGLDLCPQCHSDAREAEHK